MKYLLTGIAAITISLSSVAQNSIAVHAGYNHSSARIFTGNVKQPTGYVPGVNIGLRLKTAFEPPLFFTPMISYNLRGYTTEPRSGTIEKIETHIHYIDIAPLLNYDIKTAGKNHFSLTAGPVLGIAVSGKQKITENGTTTSSPMKFSMTNNFGYFSLALHSGISYHFNKMFIEGSYHLGFSSINNNEEVDDTNIKNRGFAISLGYWLK